MNGFDQTIMSFVNRAAQASPSFDQFVIFLSNSDLVKGGAVVAVVWAAWFYQGGDKNKNRAFLLSALLGSLGALFIARVLAYSAPMRIRPLLNPQLHFRLPSALPPQSNWTSWSSFPSDHAVLFFALAAGVWCVWRRGGTALFLYVAAIICLPRLYLGIHYPTDVLAGTAIGLCLVALLVRQPLFRHREHRRLEALTDQRTADLESREVRPGWPITDQVLDGGAFPKRFFSSRHGAGRETAILSNLSTRVTPSREQITSNELIRRPEERQIRPSRCIGVVNQLASRKRTRTMTPQAAERIHIVPRFWLRDTKGGYNGRKN